MQIRLQLFFNACLSDRIVHRIIIFVAFLFSFIIVIKLLGIDGTGITDHMRHGFTVFINPDGLGAHVDAGKLIGAFFDLRDAPAAHLRGKGHLHILRIAA